MGLFDGQVALVTGGASGIGASTARRLIEEGAQVVVADVNDDLGIALANEIGANYEHLDVSSGPEYRRVIETYDFTLGILNAGIGMRFSDLDDVTDEQLTHVLMVNTFGVMAGTRDLARAMAKRGGGRISVTASMAGLVAHPQSPAYGASKWGAVGWVQSIAPQLEARGITINAVCPGLVDTPILGPGGGDMMRGMGMSLMSADDVADAHVVALTSGLTGALFTAQATRGVNVHEFAAIEGYQSGAR